VLFVLAAACEAVSLLIPYYGDGVRLVNDGSQVAFNAPIIVGWLAVALLGGRDWTRLSSAGVALANTAVQASYLLHSIGDVRRGASVGPGMGIELAGTAVAVIGLHSLWRLSNVPRDEQYALRVVCSANACCSDWRGCGRNVECCAVLADDASELRHHDDGVERGRRA
jgi:hypothetical protein